MALPVVTVAAGGMPVVDVSATKPLQGLPVIESTSTGKFGVPVTKVSAGGIAVTYVAPPLLLAEEGDKIGETD